MRAVAAITAWLAMLLAVWVVDSEVGGERLAATPPGLFLLFISLAVFMISLGWLSDENRR